jgi:acetyl esterase/lipase
LDPDRVFAVGSPAGGRLAAMLGVTPGDPKLEGDGCRKAFSSRVTAVVAFNPACSGN